MSFEDKAASASSSFRFLQTDTSSVLSETHSVQPGHSAPGPELETCLLPQMMTGKAIRPALLRPHAFSQPATR
ncbi:hypothetical protein AD943_08640 [Gluconobacter roseus]|nr:hypothetical protein AD943_08640 [Gluconobacter roseus]